MTQESKQTICDALNFLFNDEPLHEEFVRERLRPD